MTPTDVATEVLALVEAAFVDASIDLPGRRYINAGSAWDCELLAVTVTGMSRSNPIGQPQQVANVTQVHLSVLLLRCVPVVESASGTIKLPPVDAMQASALELLVDAPVLFGALKKSLLAECSSFTLGEMMAVGPQGGMAGWRLEATVGL